MIENLDYNSKSYKVEIDQISKDEWNSLIQLFNDATIHQTWSYGQVRSSKVSHLIVKENSDIVACAQIRLYKPPVLKVGIAHVFGPLWQRKDKEKRIDDFGCITKALIEEFSLKRGLYLRINPVYYDFESNHRELISVLEQNGYSLKRKKEILVVELNKSVDELRMGLEQKWRNQLNAAERNNIEVEEGYDDKHMEIFSLLYKQMLSRKGFDKPGTINRFSEIFNSTPQSLRPRVILCKLNNTYVAGGVFSTIGNTGKYIYGATNKLGMKCKASYLVQWRILTWLKENRFVRYDLSGSNPEKGTYHFKLGLCGKNGGPATYIGEYIACKNPVNNILINIANKVLNKNL